MRSITNLNKKVKKTNKGVTLIALVITIIVLLILAGVSIATLTGEDGILDKASTAKIETNRTNAKEKVQIAVMGSFDNQEKLNIDELKTELGKIENAKNIEDTIGDFPVKVVVDNYDITIDNKGKVTVEGESNETENNTKLTTVKEAITTGTVLDEINPTTLIDEFGNYVKVPEGFRIASDSATNVTGGIVIEDANHGATVGSQFVWIPVGIVYTNTDQTESETITLNRYTFDTNGNPTAQGEKVIDSYYQELKTSNKGNTVAKDIDDFKTSATTSGGYYIGRYEARSVTERTAASNALGQITVKPNDYIYNWVTQQQAATLARGMYGEDKKFTSDLVNSYAWDTAIVFLQTFDNRIDKTIPYSMRTSLNTSLATQGTNNLTDEMTQDKICNIWDMSSNESEWTTETSSGSGYPSVRRGGIYGLSLYTTSYRNDHDTAGAVILTSFRTIIYL